MIVLFIRFFFAPARTRARRARRIIITVDAAAPSFHGSSVVSAPFCDLVLIAAHTIAPLSVPGDGSLIRLVHNGVEEMAVESEVMGDDIGSILYHVFRMCFTVLQASIKRRTSSFAKTSIRFAPPFASTTATTMVLYYYKHARTAEQQAFKVA